MNIAYYIALGITAAAHLYFWYLESVLWATPKGRKIFKTSPELAEGAKVLAANQGLYNGLLALGLVASLFMADPVGAKAIQQFIFIYIIVVGIYGAMTVNKRIFFLQSLPAVVGLVIGVIG